LELTFLIKKIVSRFLFPLPLSLEFLVVGLFLLWFTRRQRTGKWLVTCGTLVLLVFSSRVTSNALLHPLEHQYPAIAVGQIQASGPPVGFIAVLGGWADLDPGVPVSSHVSSGQMVRLVEGVRLHRVFSGSKLILSGDADSAEGMAQIAEALGVSSGDILPVPQPRDTEEESQQIGRIVGSQPFILVTSASHMPRAMGLFRKRGLQPIAAPTDFLAPRHAWEPDDFFPDGYKLFKSQTAFYEYMGQAWAKLRGKI
jgi:uncharacterized SAM-binding protein YcdF (DUF218 family)